MKRLLLLPVLVALPFATSFAAPASPEVAPPPFAIVAPYSVVQVPQTNAPGHDHNHNHDHPHAPHAPSDKPKDPLGDSINFLWQQSDEAFHKGDYPTAVKIHRAIVTLDPTDTESFGVGAWLLWSMSQKTEARAFLQQGLSANAKNAEMWSVAGQHYDLEKTFPDAKSAYLQAVELSGGKADEMLRRRLAHAAQHAGDLDLSLQTWKDLARDFPASVVVKNNLARVLGLKEKA